MTNGIGKTVILRLPNMGTIEYFIMLIILPIDPWPCTLFYLVQKKKEERFCFARRVWWYKKGGNQNPYIEEEQTTQWPKEKEQKGKQRSTKHTYKTNDRVTRTPLITGGELGFPGRVSSSCSTSEIIKKEKETKTKIRRIFVSS